MRAKCIMVQGTASSVGKSIITAGLCRLFMQDGYKVAPFKSQNMALNSYITTDGKEMGRAQVVQAEAAGIEPSVEMNPILLKPTGDKKAQVVINGVVHGNMTAAEYHEFKPELAEMVRATYERLAEENDIIVIEGAGSPAEINLRDKDIVNMGMAEIADTPVILVGDIDKGGVFAALAGTMLLLTEEERERVKGVVINKFRGDLEILKPGLQMIEDIIHVPVLGVLPYTKLDIDDEDSLAERFKHTQKANKDEFDVAVVMLPHISNFTDFYALESIKGVKVRYARKASELEGAGMIVLPGSKNTLEDLTYIRKTGIEAEIKRLNAKGTIIFGICGGYQMLGMEISDPHQTESSLLKLGGMGLLNTKTVFRQEKITAQVKGVVSDDKGLLENLKGIPVEGYEIHMGTTEYLEACIPFLVMDAILDSNLGINSPLKESNEKAGGVKNEKGTVFGTYIHGIFDNLEFTSGFINNIRKAGGLQQEEAASATVSNLREYKELQYDKLADMLRENLDMEKIYEICKLYKESNTRDN